jgi:hypothetical protein
LTADVRAVVIDVAVLPDVLPAALVVLTATALAITVVTVTTIKSLLPMYKKHSLKSVLLSFAPQKETWARFIYTPLTRVPTPSLC